MMRLVALSKAIKKLRRGVSVKKSLKSCCFRLSGKQHYKGQLLAKLENKTMQYKSLYICPVRNSFKQKRHFDSYQITAAQVGKQEAIELQRKHVQYLLQQVWNSHAWVRGCARIHIREINLACTREICLTLLVMAWWSLLGTHTGTSV